MIAREVKRQKLNSQFQSQRESIKSKIIDEGTPYDDKWKAMMDLQKLPRDSSRSRQRNRCALTGRPRGYFRRFGLSRNALRDVVMRGEAPGVTKASW